MMRYGVDHRQKSAQPSDTAGVERLRRQFAEARLVISCKSSEVA